MNERLVRFDKDDGAGNAAADEHEDSVSEAKEEKPKKVAFTPEQQAEIDRLIGTTRTKERDKAKADFEAKQKEAKEDADKAALAEQGKFKELAETAEKDKLAAIAKAADSHREAKELKMQIMFEETAEELQYAFVNKQARLDAFKSLDMELVGEDGAGMKKAFEKVHTEREYLFAAAESEPATDARQKGTRQKSDVLEKDKEAELAQRFRIRKPR